MCFKAVLHLHLLWVEKLFATERQPKMLCAIFWKVDGKISWSGFSVRATFQQCRDPVSSTFHVVTRRYKVLLIIYKSQVVSGAVLLVGAALLKKKNEVVKTLRGWNHVMQPLRQVTNKNVEANTRRYKQSSMCQHETDLWVRTPVRIRITQFTL